MGSDSGSTNQPYAAPTRLKAPAAQNGARRPTLPNNPPTAGPRMNPSPNAMPSSPNRAARASGSLTSAMGANEEETLEAVIHETTRPTDSHPTVDSSAMLSY